MSEGTDVLAIGVENKRVVCRFQKAVSWLELDPDTAKAVGEEMAKCAFEIHYGKRPTSQNAISLEIRNRLVTRVQHVIRSTQEQKKTPKYVAESVVDTILSELMK